MEMKEQIREVMTHKNIPAGQLYLYKALLEAGENGLSFKGLEDKADRSPGEVRSTLGALGKRVKECLRDVSGQPSRLLIGKGRSSCYYLTTELSNFIKETSDLEEALRESEMDKFFLHTSTAWHFVWNEEKNGGELCKFTRK